MNQKRSRFNRLRRLLRLSRSATGGVTQRSRRREYGLYESTFFQFSFLQKFSTLQLKKAFNERLNHQHWHALANDKLAFHFFIRGLGLPTPPLHAVYHPVGRFCGDAPCHTEIAELENFLREGMSYPFFVKPVLGSFGRHVALAVSYDENSDTVMHAAGRQQSVEDFVVEITSGPYGSHLMFQEALRPDAKTATLCGERLTSARLIVVLFEEGPEIVSSRWRIPAGTSVTDNFSIGGTQNLLGFVDSKTGTVTRTVRAASGKFAEVEVHPDTELPLVGTVLPNWRKVQDLCFKAATALPGLRFQHWDVAFSSSGPQLIEVNALGDMSLREIADDRVEPVLP